MRAYELHCHAKQIGRSGGRSSVAAAYRSGMCLVDERTGLVHDYTQKQGIEHTQLYAPETAPDWTQDRAQLWNAVEAKENRKNSTTAHELEVAFPAEFNAMQRREAGERLACELVARYDVAVDIAYHTPSKEGDQRNYHAHILFTTRGFDDSTADGWSKTKFRDLSADTKDANGDFYLGSEGEKTTRGKLEIANLRAFTADTMNHIAERDQLQVKTEHLSFEARGIDREPTQKMGAKATQIERIEGVSIRGDTNREIQAANDNRATLYEHKNVIDLELKKIERMQRLQAQSSNEKARIQQYSSAKENAIDLKIKNSEELRQRDAARENLQQAQTVFDAQNTLWRRVFQYRQYWEAKDQLENRQRQLADAEERARYYLDHMNRQRPSEKAKQRHAEKQAADTARQGKTEQERQRIEANTAKQQRDNAIVKEAKTSSEAAKRLQHSLHGDTVQEKEDIIKAQSLAKDHEAKEEATKREAKRKRAFELKGYEGEQFEEKARHQREDQAKQNADIKAKEQLSKERQAECEEQEKEQEQAYYISANEALDQRLQVMRDNMSISLNMPSHSNDNEADGQASELKQDFDEAHQKQQRDMSPEELQQYKDDLRAQMQQDLMDDMGQGVSEDQKREREF